MKKKNCFKIVKLGIIAFVSGILLSCSETSDIKFQNLTLNWVDDNNIHVEEMLAGEIAETKIEHVSYIGPISQQVLIRDTNRYIFLFVKGYGKLVADTSSFDIVPETIAIPMQYKSVTINVPAGDTLHYLLFTKKLSLDDLEVQESFPEENKYDIFFTKFEDCEPYTEKIKSPNTISRTVLPKDIVPRVSLGTVEAPGPDKVGAHKHPMLDQLFLGLSDNDITVHADDKSVDFKGLSLLHIPIGSSHWVSVDEGKRMYYMWMDFFLTKEGEVWLNTHKKMDDYKKESEDK